MKWLELKIDAAPAGLEPVSALLEDLGITGLVIDDEGDFQDFLEHNHAYWDYVDDHLMQEKKGLCRITFYLEDSPDGYNTLAQVRMALSRVKQEHPEYGRLLLTMENMEDADWENNWKQFYKPMEIGSRLLVVPEWEEAADPTRVKLVLNPGLILADEPTTALDVTVQAEILDLLRLARDEFDASVLIITHNMGVIADIADEVVVMYRGHVVEQGSVEQIFYSPKDDYTKRLLAAVPRIGQKLVVKDADGKVIEREKDWRDQPIAVEAKGLTITYPGHLMQPDFKAVDGIDFTIHRSEVLGLVGESGSGKSTTGRAIAGLQKVSGGSLNVLGIEMNGVKERDFKPKRADIGFVFQDPGSSFNPLMTIAENVAEPLIVHKKFSSVSDARKYVGDLLEMVQLPRAYMNRFPHELSGGQRQRASLARALALKPSLLIADEPTSALDVSVQAKVLELFKKLQAEIGFACLFITHDLAVVDMLADRIMVMHKGQIVEHGDADQIMQNPQNPYTQKLLASLPVPDPREQRKHREHLHELLAAQQ